jgi:hypothetical protein
VHSARRCSAPGRGGGHNAVAFCHNATPPTSKKLEQELRDAKAAMAKLTKQLETGRADAAAESRAHAESVESLRCAAAVRDEASLLLTAQVSELSDGKAAAHLGVIRFAAADVVGQHTLEALRQVLLVCASVRRTCRHAIAGVRDGDVQKLLAAVAPPADTLLDDAAAPPCDASDIIRSLFRPAGHERRGGAGAGAQGGGGEPACAARASCSAWYWRSSRRAATRCAWRW